MTAPARMARGRSALLAAVLSGIAPGAGHLYVGAPGRGALMVGLLAIGCWVFGKHVADSWTAARVSSLPLMFLILAVIGDAARLARRAARPFPLGPQRAWSYALVIVSTGFIAPALFAAWIAREATLAQAGGDSMIPVLEPADLVVVDLDFPELERGDVVLIDRPRTARSLSRLVGFPGETITLRRGLMLIDNRPWVGDPARNWSSRHFTAAPVLPGPGELAVISDRRDETDLMVISETSVRGVATYLLMPANFDPIRVGESIE